MASMISGCERCLRKPDAWVSKQHLSRVAEINITNQSIQYRIEISKQKFMGKNIKQCKTLPICAVHYAICQSDPYLHRHCQNSVASHTLHSYVCTVYTAHYIHVTFHN